MITMVMIYTMSIVFVIEYSSCAYMDSCRVLPSFQGPIIPLVFTRGLMLKRYFYAF